MRRFGSSIPFSYLLKRESGLWFAPLSLRAARGALVRRSVQKRTKCGTHRLDHLCAPLFVLQRLSLWESWREAPERARLLAGKHRCSARFALTKSLPIAAQRLFRAGLALSVIASQCHLSQRERLWHSASLPLSFCRSLWYTCFAALPAHFMGREVKPNGVYFYLYPVRRSECSVLLHLQVA